MNVNTAGLAAHPSRLAAAMPIVKGRCPSCRQSTLFLADGGYVTCSSTRCPNPCAAADLLMDEPEVTS